MTFAWPPMLLALALIPLGAWVYRAIGRRRRSRLAARGGPGFADGVTRPAVGPRGWIASALLVVGLSVMVVALARPQGVVDLPRQQGTVILTFDVSGSMAADDLKPTRMEAAKAAARDFVARQPSSVVVGIVAFSDAGLTVQAPTSDQAAVLATIDRLAPARGTSLANGIRASLDAIALAEDPPTTNYYSNRSASPAPTTTPAPVPPGTHRSAAIVLLSDGENNENPDPATAAQTAADRGVRIFTVGIGSPTGATLDINGFRIHTQLDEPMLQGIAQLTDGAYYHAVDAQDLHAIYDGLDPRLAVEPQTIELTPLFAGASMLLLVAGGLVSLLWLGRLP
jgi:Ca-activated chloride channel family protein